MRKKRLTIVQNRPTQFDAPLYGLIHSRGHVDLSVHYTEAAPFGNSGVDRELSTPPQWDHLSGVTYPARHSPSTLTLWRRVAREKPDYVVVCGWYPRSHLVVALLLRIMGFSVGVRSDNTLEHTNLRGTRGRIKRLVTGLVLSTYKSWHPVGSLARAYVEELGFLKRPVFYFPYAVDVEWFGANAKSYRSRLADARAAIGLSLTDYVVVGVMKWVEREDPLVLVDAVLEAAKTEPCVKLLLVGDGPLRPAIEGRARQAPHHIVKPGYVSYSQLPSCYAIADLFVHPARSEPYGVSVQEAMACGLPALVSDRVGAGAEFVEAGLTGDSFPAGDVHRLAGLLVEWARKGGQDVLRARARRRAGDWTYSRTLEELGRCLECEL
jgi:glycosyltransferase involved in cell wall biosynthesis